MNGDGNYKLPRIFGKYYLLELINVGGMAEVFKAKMFGVEGFEKIVAIKKILAEVAEDGEFIKMFIDEAKIAVQLSHPNVVQIMELGKIDDAYFIAMELVNGRDLKTIRKRLKKVDLLMPVEQSVHIIGQVCEGLDYAHRKTDDKLEPLNIVHRDISPQNVIISYEGNVKLIDFGIAKAQSKSTKTQAGMLKGKFSYMSPEQVAGQPIDRRSDIFSLGVVLYEMLTGKRLFLGKSDVETLEKIRKADVPPPSVFNSKVTEELDAIVLKALEKDRDVRYQWASEFGDDLKRYIFTSGARFSRQDLMAFMEEFFADEIDEDKDKIDHYKKLKVPKEMYNTHSGVSRPSPDDEDSIVYPASGKKKGLMLFFIMFIMMIAAAGGWFFYSMQNQGASLLIDASVPKTIIDVDEGSIYHKQCESPCRIDDILPGEHMLKLSKPGYITKEETVTLEKGKTTSKIVKMFKIGELKTIITVKSEPDEADIVINGKKVDETTPAVLSVPVGKDIVVKIEKDGYFPVEQNIGTLSANKSRELSFVMKPTKERKAQAKRTYVPSSSSAPAASGRSNAYLNINSKPWTNIYIDGKFVKSTPVIKHQISPGRHKIRFKNDKFGIDRVFPVTLKPRERKSIIKKF